MRVGRMAAIGAMMSVVAVAGCELFGDDEEEAAAAAATPAIVDPESVVAVQRVEIGRTRKGVVLAAFGTAPGLGYSRPRLVPRRDGEPGPDGYLDFDFVLDPPPATLTLPQGTTRARAVRADVEILIDRARAARGVRVHAEVGGVQMPF